jgi:hypothetical protein
MKALEFVKTRAIWIAVLLGIALTCWVRGRLLALPLERDEGEYAYSGQLLLQGILPYKIAYSSQKLPGVYGVVAVIMAVFGESVQAIHFGLLLVNLASLMLLFFITKRLFGEMAGAVAALTFAVLNLGQSVLGMAAHATHFVMLPALAGFLLLLIAAEKRRDILFCLAGFCFGLAFIMRQPALFFVLFGLLNLWRIEIREKPFRPALWRTTLFSAGAVLPFAFLCIVFTVGGVFQRFWFWTFVYVWQYGSEVSPAVGWMIFKKNSFTVLHPNWPLWLIAGMGLIPLFTHRALRGRWFEVASFAACSFLAVCPGLYFREHYFIQMLPAIALLAGAGVKGATDLLRRFFTPLRYAPAAIFAFAWAASIYGQRQFLFVLSPEQACRNTYGANPFLESIPIAKYLREHSEPRDTIAVLGSEPQIFFYANRHSATGYIFTYALMEPQPMATRMQSEMIAEITAAAPKFLVLVNVGKSWLGHPNSDLGIWSWAQEFCRSEYEIAGVADIFKDKTEYRWDSEAASYRPQSASFVTVWKRKS